jgi:anti-sigma regulatory factor (Ser/Thr protein kinase)
VTESEHSWRFAATDDAPREARRKLVAWLGAGHPALPTLALLVSETVTNVLRHGRTPAELRVAETPHGVRVEVEDGNPANLHFVPQPGGEGGYGLRLVDALATTWGCARRTSGEGKTVWFELSDDEPAIDQTR